MDKSRANSNLPLVSVIIPAYNAEVFIERTLKSVLTQTYQNIEVLVVDDGSQDQTAEIVKSIAQKDNRVILLQQPNSGVAAARNLAIEKSSGELIAPIDSDDIWYSQNLNKQVQFMLEANPYVGVVYSWSVDIDKDDKLTGEFSASSIEGEVFTILIFHNFIGNASSTLIRRTCLEKVGLYNCKLKENHAQGAEDWELYLRIAEHYQFQVVPEFLVGYRKLSNSISGNYATMAKSCNLIWESIYDQYPNMPTIIQRLSNSSLYMYFARQSNRYGQHSTTLFWLYKALQAEFITPWFRLGLYTLTITSCLKIIAYPITSLIWQDHNSWLQFKQRFEVPKQVPTIDDIDRQTASHNFKSLGEKILHQLVSKIFGNPQTWQAK